MHEALAFADDDGAEVTLDVEEAVSLLGLTGGLDAAAVSACPECRSCVLAAVALADLLQASPPHARASELLELADDAPTLHVYVVDLEAHCRHGRWRDPGYAEWRDAVTDLLEEPNRPR